MKRAFLTIFAVFAISACGGGGGGGNTPTVQMPDNPPVQMPDNPTVVITPEQQTEARELATMLRGEVANLESGEEANSLLTKIDDLLAEIENAQTEIEKLRAEIAELRADFEMVQMADNTDMQTDNGGNDSPEPNPKPCDDFRERNAQGICTYNTPEYSLNVGLSVANVIPAYKMTIFGQGVTVMVTDLGFRHTHEEISPNLITTTTNLPEQNFRFKRRDFDPYKGFFHGTAVAGILGGIFGNEDSSHGVAPFVKMIPIYAFDGNSSYLQWQFAVDNTIDIISSSHSFVGRNGLELNALTMNITLRNRADEYAEIVAATDIVHVWAAGNVFLTTFGGHQTTEHLYGMGTPWGHLSFPHIHADLEDNMLGVININADETIGRTSAGCHFAKRWCIAAYGGEQTTPDAYMDDSYRQDFSETSAATPVVSGALALLKSFRPELKMTVIRQVLLESARPLGTRKNDGMPDEVFGWGAVDVGNGIATLQAMQTADGMAYSDLRKSLPGEFSHLRGRMESVSVAIRITDRSFYNMRLSDIVGGGDSQKTSLGNAAKEMQADDSLSPENAGFGFNYANGDYDLHYAGGGNENAFRFSGGLRHDDSQSSYIGEGSSPFAAENTSDTGGYVKWTTADYAGLSAFGEYGRTQIKADYDSNSFVSKIQNARAEEWTAGFQYRDLFLHNDNLQFSARQESRISGGEMVLHYPVADGDSHKAFIGESVQTIRTETAKIPIKQKPQTIYTAGYSQKTENSKWSAAAEWNTATNAKGVSFAVELQIR